MLLPPPHPLQAMADRSVRRLRRLCAALAAVALLATGLSWPLAGALPAALAVQAPQQLPIVLTTLAMILLLVSSRLRAQLLQRATGGRIAPDPAVALAAYRRATLLSFAVLALAAVLGLAVALVSGEARYGIVVCSAAFLAMLARWPRSGEALRLPGLRQAQPAGGGAR